VPVICDVYERLEKGEALPKIISSLQVY